MKLLKRLRRWYHTPNYSRLADLEVDGIDTRDYPDFCDAFICAGSYRTLFGGYRELTDRELDILNEDSDLVYGEVQRRLF